MAQVCASREVWITVGRKACALVIAGVKRRFEARRAVSLLVLVVAAALLVIHFAVMNPGVIGIFHDDGVYTVLAKSLADGTGYRLVSLPSMPAQLKYPVLYSGVLAGLWWLLPSFPQNIALFKTFNIIALFVALLLSYTFLRRHTAPSLIDAVTYVLLIGACPLVFSLTRLPLSDTLFFTLTIGALAFQRVRGTAGTIALATVAAAAYLTRTLGVALIAAFVIWFILHRSYRRLLVFLGVTGALISPWGYWQYVRRNEGMASILLEYYVVYKPEGHASVVVWSDSLKAVELAWTNLRYAVESLDAAFFLGAVPGLRLVACLLLVVGICQSLRERVGVHHLWLAFYVLIVVGWPWHPSRFMMPVVPVALLFLVRGAQAVERGLRGMNAHWSARTVAWIPRIPTVMMALLVIVWLGLYVRADPRLEIRPAWERHESHWPGFVETFGWIRANTAANDVLATAFDPMYYLYTGRQGVRPWLYKPSTYFYPYNRGFADLGDVDRIRQELGRLGVRYLVIDPLDGYAEEKSSASHFERLLESYSAKPELVFTSSDGRHSVYRLP